MFIGRKEELSKLEKLRQSGGFQLPVIYGRRRVGKTALIRRFIQDKEAIFFTAIESSEQQNLENLSRAILAASASDTSPVFRHFQDAFEHVFRLSLEKPLVLAVDEYPYLAKACPAVSSILQKLIDEYKEQSQLFLILCGSSMSFMEEQVLGYQSPLYGRRTAQLKILPYYRETFPLSPTASRAKARFSSWAWHCLASPPLAYGSVKLALDLKGTRRRLFLL